MGTLTQRIVLSPLRAREMTGFTVFAPTNGPAYEGSGDVEYACPACGNVVCRGARRGLFAGLAFRCGSCGQLSSVPDANGRLPAFE